MGQGDPEVQERLAAYLERGRNYAVSTSVVVDVLSEERVEIGRLATLTDGTWLWPTDLAHYVRRYNVSVPAEFVAHAAALGWEPPEVTWEQIVAIRDA
ncbi:hypothetical protein [Lentzea sp. NBRC 102530]|uniref:hypothetical protein n=1 Tax=Lentzea sp. NBRC 102530 TaxID=3032201 RepID=UPI0025572389|nr:hypothetical protein [Lentzea sp. NBRC 102530]